MSILNEIKMQLRWIFYGQKTRYVDTEDYADRMERLHRNGRSDEEWEALKRKHKYLYIKPSLIPVGKSYTVGRRAEVLPPGERSEEEWEALNRNRPDLFVRACYTYVGKSYLNQKHPDIFTPQVLSEDEWQALKKEYPGVFVKPGDNSRRKGFKYSLKKFFRDIF